VKKKPLDNLSSLSMLELFRVEAENQTAILNEGLLELERGDSGPHQLETLMRAAHSLKGAARIVNLETAVRIAHAMEEALVGAQSGIVRLDETAVDALLGGTDLLFQLSRRSETGVQSWETENAAGIQEAILALSRLNPDSSPGASEKESQAVVTRPPISLEGPRSDAPERVLRLTAENLNRLLGLAGESLVASRWLRPFSDSMQRLKRMQGELAESLDALNRALDDEPLPERAGVHFSETLRRVAACQQFLAGRLVELDQYDRRSNQLAHRLYLEVLRTRMRPFSDGTHRLPRIVRDLARTLGKQVKLEILGETTQVDRDILEQLETPLAHLLRNAVDHGCETPEQRRQAGKPAEATVRVEARHSAGTLVVTVSDDGAGIDAEALRQVIANRKLVPAGAAERLPPAELFEFLFLPGVTLKDKVTEISGRGVGLDIVHSMVSGVRGKIRVTTQRGLGTRFQLDLPLTLSVVRALLVEITGEPYAFPLGRIERTLRLPHDQIHALEGRHYFNLKGESIGLLSASNVLGSGSPAVSDEEFHVIILGHRNLRYGLIVDRFLDERELVVQPLDPRLGRLKDIQAAALMPDGSPVLIVDVDDFLHSVDAMLLDGSAAALRNAALDFQPRKARRILAVDDSLTVRELLRKLLTAGGYHTEVAVDGIDGWNAVRKGRFDLVITDVDMPHMDGIELATLIKKDPALKSLPVMIVSHKDSEEDRYRGLEAGVDYYLTKGSFDDESLLRAVNDLIGEPAS
jgi:two-component system, chemotaxis family, sensor histidine kinase and response regulator WspE